MLWTAYMLGNAGLLMIYLLPQLVGVVSDQFNLTAEQSGFFASTDLIGSAIASISSFFWIRKSNWRKMALLGIAIMIIGNVLSTVATSFTVLSLLRILTGLGQGIAVALTLVMINDSKDTDRNFAIYLIVTLVFGAAFVELLPALYAPLTASPIYMAQVALSVVAIPLVIKWIPNQDVEVNEELSEERLSPRSILSLSGILLMYLAYGGLWALTELIGTSKGLTPEFIANTLSVSLLVSIPGLIIPIVIGVKFGRTIPLFIGGLGLILYGVLIAIGTSSSLFFIAVNVGSFGVNLIIPYMTGILSDDDKTGKGVVMVMPMYAIGFALGPMVLSFFLNGNSFALVSIVATVIFIIVLATYYWILIRLKHARV